jgi:hypothetical protein
MARAAAPASCWYKIVPTRAAKCGSVSHSHALLDRHEGVDQDGVMSAGDEGADIGLQVERLWPGGTSLPAIAMIGAT